MKNILLLFVILAIAISCNKVPEPMRTYLSEEVKNKFQFKEGSYWIYRDSISGIVDSYYITKSELSLNASSGDQLIDQVLYIWMERKDSIINILNESPKSWHITLEYKNHISIYYALAKHVPRKLGSTTFVYPFSPLGFYTSNQGHSGFKKKIGDFSIFSNVFPNTWEFFDSVDEGEEINDLYFNDSVGLVKMRIRDTKSNVNQVWELQGWHIVK